MSRRNCIPSNRERFSGTTMTSPGSTLVRMPILTDPSALTTCVLRLSPNVVMPPASPTKCETRFPLSYWKAVGIVHLPHHCDEVGFLRNVKPVAVGQHEVLLSVSKLFRWRQPNDHPARGHGPPQLLRELRARLEGRLTLRDLSRARSALRRDRQTREIGFELVGHPLKLHGLKLADVRPPEQGRWQVRVVEETAKPLDQLAQPLAFLNRDSCPGRPPHRRPGPPRRGASSLSAL